MSSNNISVTSKTKTKFQKVEKSLCSRLELELYSHENFSLHPNPKFIKKFKEFGLSQFFHYSS